MRRFSSHLTAVGLIGLLLAGCAETQFIAQTAKLVAKGRETTEKPVYKEIYKIGDPYQIDGVWYYPAVDYDYDETGIASWYGADFHGRRTANGGVYDMNALTAAHRTLPLPSLVRVTNLENGRSMILKVNDRGPYARGRIIDLSRRSAQLLGSLKKGTARVRVQILARESRQLAARLTGKATVATMGTPITVDRLPKPAVTTQELPPPGGEPVPVASAAKPVDGAEQAIEPAPGLALVPGVVSETRVVSSRLFVQAGAYAQYTNANRARAFLSSLGPVKVTSILVEGRDLFRVRLGPLSTVAEADGYLDAVVGAGYTDARIIVE